MIQSRYGWRDDEVLDLPFARFREVLRQCVEAVERDRRDRMVEAAFVGWQAYMIQPREKGRKPMAFSRWIERLGLAERPKPISDAERARIVGRAKQNAGAVMRAFH